MIPQSAAEPGFGPGFIQGTKHLFGEQSGSSAVCLRQLFPQRPIFSLPPTSCSDWLRAWHAVASSTPGETALMEAAGVWKEGADPRTGGEETQERFFLLFTRPLPSSCKSTSKPSVAGETSAGQDERGKRRRTTTIGSALRNGTLLLELILNEYIGTSLVGSHCDFL